MYDSVFRLVFGFVFTAAGLGLLYVSLVAAVAVLLVGVPMLLVGCVARGVVEGTFELEARRRNGDVPG
jgi:small ligand-binding sensory domain FIST